MNYISLGLIIAVIIIVVALVVLVIRMGSGINNLNEQLGQKKQADENYRQQQAQLQNDQMLRQGEQMARQGEQIKAIERQLTDTMNQVSRSIGEMKGLSSGMEDLKRMMSNVKSRGILGEIQLGAILEDILAPGQYEENVAVKGDSQRVEYAVKFPAEDGSFVYLPIDAKFPGDAYINLLDAYDSGDKEAVKKAKSDLNKAIVKAAGDIRAKYIYPPYTTDFGIMFLPFEGLYAEVLRLNLVETLQKDFRVNIAGPTTMAAMLNSFQLGFKSLALQQSSGEVWDTLAKVKMEFDKFADVLDKTQTKLNQAQNELETLVGARTRSIQKALDKAAEGKQE